MTAAPDELRLADHQHDCETDDRQGDYALLADVIGECFNPPDNDVAEESILVDALYDARDYIAATPCVCTPAEVLDGYTECKRCRVLGRLADKTVDR